ncbi:hypothetical protein, partial [Ralstonia pseudosolanacearum]|uniref:hypothetical protein n=1 Tax=Ralstonia pseudosolanacearum TaxID=1310165 RepID=UPI001FF9AFF0
VTFCMMASAKKNTLPALPARRVGVTISLPPRRANAVQLSMTWQAHGNENCVDNKEKGRSDVNRSGLLCLN